MQLRGNGVRAAAVGAALGGVLAARAIARQRREKRRSVASEWLPRSLWEQAHEQKVRRIARQLAGRTSDRPVSLRKKAAPHQVPKRGDLRRHDEKIDISDLNAILDIDPVERTCVAEPGVTFVDLVAATLRLGLVPIVVPELKTITIGGAVSGCSIESMSYRYGGFHDTCLEYEVITAKGEVLACTPDNEHALVHQMIHGSFGTLGILSKLKFRLVPAKRYVHVEYEKYGDLQSYLQAIQRRFRAQDVDFMDGIIHSPTEYVLSLGRFTDEAPYTNRYDWTKVYFKSTAKRAEDYLETPDYFFRYDRGVTHVHPQSWIGRVLFAKLLDSSKVLRAAEKMNWVLKGEQPDIILDVFLPVSKVPAFLEWYQREFQYFPLWCVPYRRVRDYEWIDPGFYRGLKDELFLDLAIYGMKQTGGRNHHRLMEEKLRELGGIKTLISHNYYSPEEFWSTWNRANYDAVKKRVDPDNVFRDLYTKTCRAAMGIAQ